MKREALVFGGEFVGMVDAVVAAAAEGGFVGGAEHRGLVLVAHVALDLHQLSPLFLCSVLCSVLTLTSVCAE